MRIYKIKKRFIREHFITGIVSWWFIIGFSVLSISAAAVYALNPQLNLVAMTVPVEIKSNVIQALFLIIPLGLLMPALGYFIALFSGRSGFPYLLLISLPVVIPFALCRKMGELFCDPFYGALNIFDGGIFEKSISFPWYGNEITSFFLSFMIIFWKLLPMFILLNMYLLMKKKHHKQEDVSFLKSDIFQINVIALLLVPSFVIQYLYSVNGSSLSSPDLLLSLLFFAMLLVLLVKRKQHE